MKKLFCYKVPAWISVCVILIALAGLIYPWTGVYDYRIAITNITDAGNLYMPYWMQGYVYNLDIPLYSYVIQYRLYANDEAWETLQEVNLDGVRDYRVESLLSRRRLITAEHFTIGFKYQFRIYCIDLDSNIFPDHELVNIPEGGGVGGWDAENVKTSTIIEGVIP